MAQTTNVSLQLSDGWHSVATDASSVSIKANMAAWKKWRIYFSEDGSVPPGLNVGDLYEGSTAYITGSFTGTLYLLNTNDDEIDFSITIAT